MKIGDRIRFRHERENAMMRKLMTRATMVGILAAVFALGYLCGSVGQQRVDAQGLGSVLEQAGKAGGSLGTAGQLGTSIVQMQDHVSGLQKNLDTLKQIQSALTGK
jgi:hypothetical protein